VIVAVIVTDTDSETGTAVTDSETAVIMAVIVTDTDTITDTEVAVMAMIVAMMTVAVIMDVIVAEIKSHSININT
jgi:hypothetical protein